MAGLLSPFAFTDPRHKHRALKMSKTKNIRRLKKRSRALPSSPWLGLGKRQPPSLSASEARVDKPRSIPFWRLRKRLIWLARRIPPAEEE
jgi:hypothetical protein